MLLAVIALCAFFTVRSNGFTIQQPDDSATRDIGQLAVEIAADKQSYLPGELIGLKFNVTNRSDQSVALPGEASVWDGHLKVFVAYQDEEYKEYRGPGWGLKDVVRFNPIVLAPGVSHETEATILYHKGKGVRHLSAVYQKQIVEKEMTGGYALAEAGGYRIKAVLYDFNYAYRIESEPIRIVIEEPVGADLKVWNRLKENSDYGRFIQTGSAGKPSTAESRQLVENLTEIADAYPESNYLKGIRLGLSKHASILERLDRQRVR
jgi:hypothetical protein